MFSGKAICNLDSKSRLIFPSRFRKYISPEANNRLYLTSGMDGSILVYPGNIWEKYVEKLSVYNVFDPDQRQFLRIFLENATECELDSQNRILIPQDLIEFGGLEKEVIIIGLIDKLEIWNPERKKQYDEQSKITYEEVARKVTNDIFKPLQ